MYIKDIIWLDQIIEKLEVKHHIAAEEVEEVFSNKPRIRKAQKGRVQGEDLYFTPMVGQTADGTFLWCLFINVLVRL